MLRIDAHQHFWQFDPIRDSWITTGMQVLSQDFLPSDLAGILTQNGIDGTIAVQAPQNEEETDFLLELAAGNSFIKGVVGWVDLQAEDIHERLQHYRQFAVLKGFRHILQGEANRALMLEPAFKRGISLLNKYGFTFDLLVHPDQLKYSDELVKAFPDQKFVLDHIAKPPIKDSKLDEWATDIVKLAENDNVFCKISGLVTEADWENWQYDDLKPYLDVVVNAFGVERCMFGSDWPVCLLAADYKQVKGVIDEYFKEYSLHEKELIFGGNAVKFYNI